MFFKGFGVGSGTTGPTSVRVIETVSLCCTGYLAISEVALTVPMQYDVSINILVTLSKLTAITCKL